MSFTQPPDEDGMDARVPSEVSPRDARVLELTMRAVNDNACGWHNGEDGKARALNVIAVWTSTALQGRLHPSVEKIAEDAGW